MKTDRMFAVVASLLAVLPAAAVDFSDFDAVTNRAVQTGRPLVAVFVSKDCHFCRRLEKACAANSFSEWIAGKPFDVAWVTGATNSPACRFCMDSPNALHDFPTVAVWAPAKDGTAFKTNFVGRRKSMPVTDARTLAECFMLSLDGILRTEKGSAEISGIVGRNVMKVDARKNVTPGADGTVTMRPESGLISEDGAVTLTAVPARGSIFVGWRSPDGKWHSFRPRIQVNADCTVGTYTAEFTAASNCAPAVVANKDAVVKMRKSEPFEFAFKVNDDARPLIFMAENLPPGLALLRNDGVIRGTPRRSGKFKPLINVISSQRRERVAFTMDMEVEE